MIEVPAAVTISGVLDSADSGATESAAGVTPKPARKVTLSLTIISCAMRLVLSGTAPSSLIRSSTFLPATVSPFCAIYSLIPAAICLPVDCCWPVIGRMKPILTLSCASAASAADSATTAHATAKKSLRFIDFLPVGDRSPELAAYQHSGWALSRLGAVSPCRAGAAAVVLACDEKNNTPKGGRRRTGG